MNAKSANTGSDWSKVDAHVIQAESRKVLLSVRHSPEVVEYFRATVVAVKLEWMTR
jgi:hypothetical protein